MLHSALFSQNGLTVDLPWTYRAARMKTRITITLIKSLKPKEKPFEVRDTELKGFLLRVQPSGAMNYYYSYRSKEGTRKRFRIGSVTNVSPNQARDAAENVSAEVIQGVDVAIQKKQLKQQAIIKRLNTFKIFLEDSYKPWVLTHRKTGDATVKSIKYNFSLFMPLALEEISVYKVEEWRKIKLKSGAATSTVNRQVAALRSVLSKAVEWDILEHHPLGKLKQLKTDRTPRVRYLKPDEETDFFEALENRDKELKEARERGNQWRKKRRYELKPDLSELHFADRMYPMIVLSLKAGLRRGEVFSLCWSDVLLEGAAPTVTVRAEEAKSSRVRYVPLSPLALDVLTKWQSQRDNQCELVFPSDKGVRLDNVKKSWASILKLAQVESFRWHDMRHDFASRLVMKGVPLNTVRELCGHADLNTTLRYAHLAPDHKAEAIALLG